MQVGFLRMGILGAILTTWFTLALPDARQIDRWNALPPGEIQLRSPGATLASYTEIARLTPDRLDRVSTVLSEPPSLGDVQALDAECRRAIARTTFIVGPTPAYPSDSELEALESLQPRALHWVTTAYPSPDDAARINRVPGAVTLTVVSTRYPRHQDRPGLEAVSPSVRLSIVTDYWPGYSQMDVLNLLPHKKRLRIVGMAPPIEHWPYIANLKRVEEIQVDAAQPLPLGEGRKRPAWLPEQTRFTWIWNDLLPPAEWITGFGGHLRVQWSSPPPAEIRAAIQALPLAPEATIESVEPSN